MLPYNIDLTGKTVFLTGVAGFIGSNLAKPLLNTVNNIHIVGIDSMNDYYDVRLKEARLKEIEEIAAPLSCISPLCGEENRGQKPFTFILGNIADRTLIDRIFAEYHPQIVVNLAAQAGVRYSITNPDAYIESNLIGFYNILEACRHANDNDNANVNPNPNVNANEQEGAAKVKVKVNVNVDVEVKAIGSYALYNRYGHAGATAPRRNFLHC